MIKKISKSIYYNPKTKKFHGIYAYPHPDITTITAMFNKDFIAKFRTENHYGTNYHLDGIGQDAPDWMYHNFYIQDEILNATTINGGSRNLSEQGIKRSRILANCLYKNKADTTYAGGKATYNFNKNDEYTFGDYEFLLDMKGRPLIQKLDEGHFIYFNEFGSNIGGMRDLGIQERDSFIDDNGGYFGLYTYIKFRNGCSILTYSYRGINNYRQYQSIVNFPNKQALLENPLYFYEPTFYTAGINRNTQRNSNAYDGDIITICINEVPLVTYNFKYFITPDTHDYRGVTTNSYDMCDAYTKVFTQKDKLLLWIANFFHRYDVVYDAIVQAKNEYKPYNRIIDGIENAPISDIPKLNGGFSDSSAKNSYDTTADKVGDTSTFDVGWDGITLLDLIDIEVISVAGGNGNTDYYSRPYIKDEKKLTDTQKDFINGCIYEFTDEKHNYGGRPENSVLGGEKIGERNYILINFVNYTLTSRNNGDTKNEENVQQYGGGVITNPYPGWAITNIDLDPAKIINVKCELIEEIEFSGGESAYAIKVTATPEQNVDSIAWFGKIKNLGAFESGKFYIVPDDSVSVPGVFEVTGENSIIVYYMLKGLKLGDKEISLGNELNTEKKYAYNENSEKIVSGEELENLVKNLEVRSAEFGGYKFTQDKPMEIYINGASLLTRSYPQADERVDW